MKFFPVRRAFSAAAAGVSGGDGYAKIFVGIFGGGDKGFEEKFAKSKIKSLTLNFGDVRKPSQIADALSLASGLQNLESLYLEFPRGKYDEKNFARTIYLSETFAKKKFLQLKNLVVLASGTGSLRLAARVAEGNQNLQQLKILPINDGRNHPKKPLLAGEDEELAKCVADSKNLKSICFDFSIFDDNASLAIVDAVAEKSSLARLSLVMHSPEFGASYVAKIIENNQNLQQLSVQNSAVLASAQDRKKILEVVENSRSLEVLDLSFLGAVDVEDFNRAIASNVFLTRISTVEDCENLQRNRLVQDFVQDLAKTFLGVRFLRMVQQNKQKLPEDFNFEYLTESLATQVHKILREEFSAPQIIEIAKAWHKPFSQILVGKVKDYAGMSWPSLFGAKKEIEIPEEIFGKKGYKMVTLNNHDDLAHEALRLNHCVNSYTNKCFVENSHIISIRNEKGESVSCFELSADYERRKLGLKQHKTFNDEIAGPRDMAASLWLLDQIDDGKIEIDFSSLEKDKKMRTVSAPFVQGVKNLQYIGFDALDDKKVRKVIRQYLTKVLPTFAKNLIRRLCDDEVVLPLVSRVGDVYPPIAYDVELAEMPQKEMPGSAIKKRGEGELDGVALYRSSGSGKVRQ